MNERDRSEHRADLDRLEAIGKLIGATVESERTLY